MEVRDFVRCTLPTSTGSFIAQVCAITEYDYVVVFDGSRFLTVQSKYCETLKAGQAQFDFAGRLILEDTLPTSKKEQT